MRKTLVTALFAALLWALPATAETVRLTFLHANDIYEYRPVNGIGGLAELLTRVEDERTRAPEALLTFGGDLLSPSLASQLTGGAHMVEALNEMGVAAAVLGNHEFDAGPDNAARQVRASRFPWLVTNVFAADGTPFAGGPQTMVVTIDGVKVGLFGLLTVRTAELATAPGVSFTAELPAARAAVASLRARGAEVVVALTHLDLDDDRRLAREVKGIDLILGGHDHDPISWQEGGPLVVKAGADGHYLAAVELTVTREHGETRVAPAAWRFVSTAGAAPHPRLLAMMAKTDALLDDALGQAVATTRTALDSRTDTVRTREAALGNLVADCLRTALKADVALLNGGGLRGNRQYAAGTVLTRRDLRAEMPFNNVLVALEVTGAQLWAALENGLSQVEAKAGRFPQVSGMTIRYDPARAAGARVVAVSIAGQPLQPTRRYRLATVDYLSKGGDGYVALKTAAPLVDTASGPMQATAVIEVLAGLGTVAPTVEGRITALR